MGHDHIVVERRDRLTFITINRPEVMNALHPPANLELNAAFDAFSRDREAWIAILTGAGSRAFCAGNDLKYQAEHGPAAVREAMANCHGGFGGLTRRFDCVKPIIAAVNGLALGGGFEIALACDLIVAAEGASFGLPEPRVGLMAAAGGVHRLPRHLPFHVAMGMLLTGHRLGAAEALERGLVNEVVGPEELLAAAERWAGEILACSPMSIRATKEAAHRGLSLPLEEALDTRFPAQEAMLRSEDLVEGPRAFAEKRRPEWKGR